MEKITVALVDDQTLFVDSLKTVLELATEDIVVVGISFNGEEAVQLVEEKRPDIVLMDVRMPEMDGVEATRIIHERFPETHVMMLTTFDDDEYVIDALHNGAVGYILKNIPAHELVNSIRAIKDGTMQMSPQVAQKLLQYTWDSHFQSKQEKSKPAVEIRFSPREKDVLRLLIQGHHNREIAEKLFVSEQTVKNHLSVIYAKMGVDSRAQAIHFISSNKIDLR